MTVSISMMLSRCFYPPEWVKAYSRLIIASLFLGGPVIVHAADQYPQRPVSIVVPYGSGGIADVVPRVVTNSIGSEFSQPFIVENKPGAGGMIGSDYVRRQPADGHTILLAATNNLVMNQFLFKDQKLDPLKSFIPVAKIATVPLVVVVNSSLPINNLSELVEYIRKHPESTNFNSPSMGTMPHIAGEVFLETLGLRATHIPYRGGGGMATALGSGEVQFAVIGYTTVQSVISSGRVRPLAVIARERLKVLGHVPTVAQAGYPQLLDAIPPNWWAFAVKSGTSPAIVAQLSKVVKEQLMKPAVIKSYQDMGMVASFEDSAQMKKELLVEAETWQKKIAGLNISVQ